MLVFILLIFCYNVYIILLTVPSMSMYVAVTIYMSHIIFFKRLYQFLNSGILGNYGVSGMMCVLC